MAIIYIKLLRGTKDNMNKEQEEEEENITEKSFADAIKLIKTDNRIYKIIVYFLVIWIILSLMTASHNLGYGKGYNYVLGYKDDYIEKFCDCYNSSLSKIQRPIYSWNNNVLASIND